MESAKPTRTAAARRYGLWGVAVLVLVAGGYGLWRVFTPPAPTDLVEPPTVDLSGLDAPVVRAIEEASAEIRRAPRAPAGWGKLGMILAAHGLYTPAQVCFVRAEELVLAERGSELIAVELRTALNELGKVVGAVYTDDLLDRIFSTFCIGK